MRTFDAVMDPIVVVGCLVLGIYFFVQGEWGEGALAFWLGSTRARVHEVDRESSIRHNC